MNSATPPGRPSRWMSLWRLSVRGGEPPGGWLEWVLVFVVLAGACAIVFPLTRKIEQAKTASSAGVYLELAVNAAWCGRYPYLTSTLPDNAAIIDLINLDMAVVGPMSIQQFVRERVGSLEKYCGLRAQPFVMNEISLSAVESAVLRAFPSITFTGLARALAWLRLGLLVIFGACLVRARSSLLFAACLTAASMYLTVLAGGNALYSQYPFFMPVILVGIGVAAASLSAGWHRRNAAWWLISASLGAWAGFLGNLRTSLYPEAIVVSVLFLWFAARDRREAGQSLGGRRWLALACVACLAGLAAFDAVYVRPIRGVPSTSNSSAHGIAHPLVLGLALPPNALAAREGIEWRDEVGHVLARRIDPAVPFLGTGYERALLAYYRRLWADYPGEMARIYEAKLLSTTRSTFEFLAFTDVSIFWDTKDGRWLSLAARPLSYAGSAPMLLLFGGLVVSGWIGWRRRDSGRVFLLCGIGIVGVLTFAEAAIILGSVVLWYTSVLLVCTIFAGCLCYQWAIDGVWRLAAGRGIAGVPASVAMLAAVNQRLAQGAAWTIRQLLIRREQPSSIRVGACVAATVLAFVMAEPQWLSIERSATPDGDAIARVAASVNAAWCGRAGLTAASSKAVELAAGSRDQVIVPLREVIQDQFGSMEVFCASAPVVRPAAWSALSLVQTAMFRGRPELSLAGLSKGLHYLRVAAALAGVMALAAAGQSAAVGVGAGLLCLQALVSGQDRLLSVSAFLPAVILMSTAVFCLVGRHCFPSRLQSAAHPILIAGWSLIVIGLNPAYWPEQGALAAVGLWLARATRRPRPQPAVDLLVLWGTGACAAAVSLVVWGVVDHWAYLIASLPFLALAVADWVVHWAWTRRGTNPDITIVLAPHH